MNFFECLTSEYTVWLFVGVIFTVACGFYGYGFRIFRKTLSDIKDAIDILDKLEGPPLKAFYNQYDYINDKMSQIKELRHVWTNFVISHFQQPVSNGLLEKVYLSHLPDYYFNRDSVLGTRINLPQFLSLPNYLIGLGLTFTFIGLAAALHVAQSGLVNGNGQQALQELLKVASVKFISSIAGIGTSLIVTFLQKMELKKVQDRLDKFCLKLEECLEYKPSEKLLFESYSIQEKHSSYLSDMAINISKGVGDMLSQQLAPAVAKALEPLANEIRQLAQKFSGSNEDALKSVLESFIEQLRKNSGDEIDNLVQTVSTLKDSLDVLVGNIKLMTESFGTKTQDSSERLISVLDSFSSTFVPVSDGIAKFGESLSNLQTVAGSIQQAGGSISGAAEISNQSMSNLANAVTDISSNMRSVQEILLTLNKSLLKVDESSEKLNQAGNTISYAANNFKTSAESIENAGTRFEEKLKSMEIVVGGISNTANVLDIASQNIQNATAPLSETTKEFPQLIQTIQTTELKIKENYVQMETLLQNIKGFSEIIPGLWEQYQGRFEKVDVDLQKAFEVLANGSENFKASAEGFIRTIDDSFTRALDTLGGAIAELTEERQNSQSVTDFMRNPEVDVNAN